LPPLNRSAILCFVNAESLSKMMILMKQLHAAVTTNNCTEDVFPQGLMLDEEDRPPSNRRTLGCAFTKFISPAWFRKA
jgi:hypothetical protein